MANYFDPKDPQRNRQQAQKYDCRGESADIAQNEAIDFLAHQAMRRAQIAQRTAVGEQIDETPQGPSQDQKAQDLSKFINAPEISSLLEDRKDFVPTPEQELELIRRYGKSVGAQLLDALPDRPKHRSKADNYGNTKTTSEHSVDDASASAGRKRYRDIPLPGCDQGYTQNPVPVTVNPSLNASGVRARAIAGERIEVGKESDKNDEALIAHEKRHIAQQQRAIIDPSAPQIDEKRAETEANAHDGRLSPCGVKVLNQTVNGQSNNDQPEHDFVSSIHNIGFTKSEMNKAIKANTDMQLRIDFIIRLKAKLSNEWLLKGQGESNERYKIDRSLPSKSIEIDAPLILGIADFQRDCLLGKRSPKESYENYVEELKAKGIELKTKGVIDPFTWLAIEDVLFDEYDQKTIIGKHVKGGTTIVSGINSVGKDNKSKPVSEQTYNRCRELVEYWGKKPSASDKNSEPAGGFFDRRIGRVNLVAIRNAEISGNKIVKSHNLEDRCRFGSSRASLKSCPANKERDPFNDVMLMIWTEETQTEDGKTKIEYYVDAYPMSVDPGFKRSDAEAKNAKYSPNGTSHLRDGQYAYKLKAHGTSSAGHMKAVLRQACPNGKPDKTLMPKHFKPDSFGLFLSDAQCKIKITSTEIKKTPTNKMITYQLFDFSQIDINETDKKNLELNVSFLDKEDRIEVAKLNKIIYPALVKARPTEVFRESTNNPLGKFSYEDVKASRVQIANGHDEFRDTKGRIAINIHSGTRFGTTSQGCQNMRDYNYFPFLQKATKNLPESTDEKDNKLDNAILYTLIDASKVEVEDM